jgi:hypothetical protein
MNYAEKNSLILNCPLKAEATVSGSEGRGKGLVITTGVRQPRLDTTRWRRKPSGGLLITGLARVPPNLATSGVPYSHSAPLAKLLVGMPHPARNSVAPGKVTGIAVDNPPGRSILAA